MYLDDVDSGSDERGVGDDVGSDADVSTGTAFSFKGVFASSRRLYSSSLPTSCPLVEVGSGLLVILASVRQQGLYPPVEAVPPKPSSLSLLNEI